LTLNITSEKVSMFSMPLIATRWQEVIHFIECYAYTCIEPLPSTKVCQIK